MRTLNGSVHRRWFAPELECLQNDDWLIYYHGVWLYQSSHIPISASSFSSPESPQAMHHSSSPNQRNWASIIFQIPGVAFLPTLLMLIPHVLCATEISRDPDAQAWVTNGTVWAVEPTTRTIYIGGDFTYVGPVTGSARKLDRENSLAPSPFPHFNGTVSKVVSDGSRNWYIAGSFTRISGQPLSRLARISSTFQPDLAWQPEPNDSVTHMASSATSLFIGGKFSRVAEQTRNKLAQFDVPSGTLTPWNPQIDGEIRAMVLHNEVLYIAGTFTMVNGQSRKGLAAFLSNGELSTWNPDLQSSGLSPQVYALCVEDGVAYVNGFFSTVAGQSSPTFAAIRLSDGQLTPVQYSTSRLYFNVMTATSSTLYVAGKFPNIGNVARTNVAALDAHTGAITGFVANTDDEVYDAHLADGILYLGGRFSHVNGVPRRGFAAVDADTGNVLDQAAHTDGSVYTIGLESSDMVIGGSINSAGGFACSGAIGLDPVDGSGQAWNPMIQGSVLAIHADGENVFLGGRYTSVGGQARANLAAVDAQTALTTSWRADAIGGPSSDVFTFAANGNALFCGGHFSQIGNQPRLNLAVVDKVSGDVLPWRCDSDTDGFVRTLEIAGDSLYVGGYFNTLGGQTRLSAGAARLSDGTVTDWAPHPNLPATVLGVMSTSILVDRGQVFVGTLATDTSNEWLSLKAYTQSNAERLPCPVIRENFGTAVISRSILIQELMLLGGLFDWVDTNPRNNVAMFDRATGQLRDWTFAGDDGQIYDMNFDGRYFYIAGTYTTINGEPRRGFARFELTRGNSSNREWSAYE